MTEAPIGYGGKCGQPSPASGVLSVSLRTLSAWTFTPTGCCQYFPKGSDLSVHSPQHLAGVAGPSSTGGAQVLGWKTPAEAMAEFLDSQAA